VADVGDPIANLTALLDAAVRRAELVQALTAGLAPLLDEVEIADFALSVGMRSLGGHTASLCMRAGEDELYILASEGYSPEVVSTWGRFPLDAHLPASEAVRTGEPVFIESAEERDERYPAFATSAVVDSAAHVIAPLTLSDGRTLGALVIGFSEAREFSPEDRLITLAFAGQVAIAIERARLYKDNVRARERLAFLARSSTLLASTLDLEETLDYIVRLAAPEITDWSNLVLLEAGRIRLATMAHDDQQRWQALEDALTHYPVSLTADAGVARVLRTGEAEVYQETPEELLKATARNDEHLAALHAAGFGPLMLLPLRAAGEIVGCLSMGNDEARELTHDDVLLAEELVRRAQVAIEKALLFRERTEVARALQASLLPPSLPAIPGLDLAARYVPLGAGAEVGGDFYDLFPVSPDSWLVVMGDVSGKGAYAASISGLARHVIRAAAIADATPSRLLEHFNDVLWRVGNDVLPDADADAEEPRFCTLFVALVRPRPGSIDLTLASAGHPLPLVIRGDDVGDVGVPGPVAGVVETADYTDVATTLTAGETMVVFTDGVSERRRGQSFFGDGAFEAVLASNGDAAAEVLAGVIEKSVTEFGDGQLTDDLALLVLRAT
jgi:serine phosphatase RsbU (regulator of sigma subunit)